VNVTSFLFQLPDQINGFFAFLKVLPGPPFPEELHTRMMCGCGAKSSSASDPDPANLVHVNQTSKPTP